MNTPAHAALSLLLIGRAERDALPVAVGALAPDAPMIVFYAWERLVRGVPESVIWSERYFDPAWQTVFDIPHSIPILFFGIAAIFLVRRRAGATKQGSRWRVAVLFLASMLIHAFADLPLHREDAHRHFFPLSDWKFMSPVSYWDPSHFGGYAVIGEIIFVFAVTVYLYRRYEGRGRKIVGALGLIYATFGLFVIFTWSGMTG